MTPPELTVIVPTFNEQDNIEELYGLLQNALSTTKWEMVVVDDDSSDGTAEKAFSMNRKFPNVRCLKRIGRRGLSSACIEGICSSSAPYVAVIDADMQHDESILPAMLEKLKSDGLDLVVGSRFTKGGSTGDMPALRVKMSRFATWIGSTALGVKTTDPMSGFFMLKRDFFYEVVHNLSGKGFKILLDIIASSKKEVQFDEVPYDMRARQHGESKLDSVVLWEYLLLLGEKTIGKYIPIRFIFFVMMGLMGSLFHLAILLGTYYGFGTPFVIAQSLAVMTAIPVNYFFNNMFTYSDRRYKGIQNFRGLLIFYISCAPGAVINVMVALYFFNLNIHIAVSGLLGAGVGAVWNYSLSSQYAWKKTS
jgi:dolichol-phosphate mannosyltransferase